MEDMKMFDNEPPSGSDTGLVEAGFEQKEASGNNMAQKPVENTQSRHSEDKTRVVTSDIHLPDVADDERNDSVKAENETVASVRPDNVDGVTGKAETEVGDGTITNADTGNKTDQDAKPCDRPTEDCKIVDDSRVDARPVDETQDDAKLGNETRSDSQQNTKPIEDKFGIDTKTGCGTTADSKVGKECSALTGAESNVIRNNLSTETSLVTRAGDAAKAGDESGAEARNQNDAMKVDNELHAKDKVASVALKDKKAEEKSGGNAHAMDAEVNGPVAKCNGSSGNVENRPRSSSPANVDCSTPNTKAENGTKRKTWLLSDDEVGKLDEAGTLEEQAQFIKEVESFHKEHFLEFKAPKFYGQPLNCLKLWRAVIKLGGYDVVTASKLWRQVGESFHPPKTCTTVSWTFRIFYEKALLEYEKYLRQSGELQFLGATFPQFSSVEKEANNLGSGSGRARRDAAARAMQGWHAQRLLGSGDVTEPIVKDKSMNAASRREKNLKSIGSQKQRLPINPELHEKPLLTEGDKQVAAEVVDVGPPADWVKINVRENKDCFEIYALVPGLLREEVRVQSDPAGRLVITGQPEQLDNPWGITPFKKVVNLPSRIDPLQTSAVVSLHGRLYVRVPFEQ